MNISSRLLGPPALAAKSPFELPEKPFPSESPVDPLVSHISNINLMTTGTPPMGLTENLSPTFLSSGNPCLDFFFHVVPDTPFDQLIQRLQIAWLHDPLTTLKLICNLRGVRGTGKSDKEGFYAAAFWLHRYHPRTLALNLKAFADFGYFKDFPEILYRILEGPQVRKLQKEERLSRKRARNGRRFSKEGKFKRGSRAEAVTGDDCEEEKEVGEAAPLKEEGEAASKKEDGEAASEEKEGEPAWKKDEKVSHNVNKETARVLRKAREIAKAAKALKAYNLNANYAFLFDCVADMFADLLKSDTEALNSKQYTKISLAAKWCPSIDSSYDKATLICEAIARRVFPRESHKEYEEIDESHYAFRVRDRLRKEVLVPLHKILELPEIYMSANQWNSLPYDRVASVAMKTYKTLFYKHDQERFEEYLENVKSGKARIAAGALLPHEIIGALSDEDGGKVAELQWARLVKDLARNGKLTNCIAVCDVSGSMEGIPMEVSVALGLLVSELSEEPWKGKVITFSEDPRLHLIEGDSLLEKTAFVRRMEWGGNTDLQKVFDRILDVAVENKLSEDQLIQRIFVFSDMEFDDATGIHALSYFGDFEEAGIEEDLHSPSEEQNEFEEARIEEEQHCPSEKEVKKKRQNLWETDYQVIRRKFREQGYDKVPEIVFWNLRNSSSTPVISKQSGVALVSGFSKNLLTLFLEGGGIVNPEEVMGLAIAGEEYKKLVVYD